MKTEWVILRILLLTAAAVFVFLTLPYMAKADMYASGMLGAFNTGNPSPALTKFVNFGLRDEIYNGIVEQGEVGGWFDSVGRGRQGSMYGAYQIGVEVDSFLTTRFMAGPAFITAPDVMLGGNFPQFTEELYIGLVGRNGNQMGVKYKHFSSAGLVTPNEGRDMIGLEISLP